MNDFAHPAGEQPQLRTLLLTDLCDSTTLVERLGDIAAAELFRAHDRLVLELQQRWRGRLIDRSDGLLLLFERPIDGLGFALDYARGLRELGHTRNLHLEARAGLHVGEVLTWRNSAAAVQAGAKPLEVEGLAKPLAGRLMALARPGQILLSATAELLARRAARELGERAEHLLWKSHGRWRFKGLPEALEVHEVGEPGLAPLRTPKASGKAWRDIPLWRRPAALAAEVLLLVGIGIGAWFVTRPQPAIAFNERDWVVIADLRNLTGQGVLDDSLEQAFRISLEQSRHVNVLSDLKVRDTLQRMQREPDTALDRTIASEIAIRDGARAVILPTVAEIGGRIRVSVEVVDPRTQTTVYTEYADGRGLDSTLHSIDKVTAALRERLGEELKAIERDSEPLPQVTTKNLDALRAYALGRQAFDKSSYEKARAFFQRAVALDPEFALAHIGLIRVDNAQGRQSAGEPHLRRAQALRDRLPARERLYLDAWVARLDAPEDELALWQQMASPYPDDFRSIMNAAYALFRLNRFEEGLEYAKRAAAPQNVASAQAQRLVGDYFAARNQFTAADAAYRAAIRGGIRIAAMRRADALAASRRFADAEAAWKRVVIETNDGVMFDRVTFHIDRGRWQAAYDEAMRLSRYPQPGGLRASEARLPVAIAAWMLGRQDEATRILRQNTAEALQAAKAATSVSDAAEYEYVAIMSALAALRIDPSLRDDALIRRTDTDGVARWSEAVRLLQVRRAVGLTSAGDAQGAIELLQPLLADRSAPFQAYSALHDAYIAAGRADEALAMSRWLRANRGFAYLEQGCSWCHQGMNVVDTTLAALKTAELLARQEKFAAAREELAAFDAQWSGQPLPPHLRARRESLERKLEGVAPSAKLARS